MVTEKKKIRKKGKTDKSRTEETGEPSSRRENDTGESSSRREKDTGEFSFRGEKDSRQYSSRGEKDTGESSSGREKGTGEFSSRREKDTGESSSRREKDTGESSFRKNEEDEIQVVEETVIIQPEEEGKKNEGKVGEEKEEEKKEDEKEKNKGFSFGSKLKKMNPLRKLGKSKKEDSVEIKDEEKTVNENPEEKLKKEDSEKEVEPEKESLKKVLKTDKKKKSRGELVSEDRKPSNPEPGWRSQNEDEEKTKMKEERKPKAMEERGEKDKDSMKESRKISAKEKLKQKLERKKISEETRNPKLLRQQSSRVEDRLKEEDYEAQIAFDKHALKSSNKFEAVEKNSGEEAFEFFSKVWSEDTLEEVVVENRSNQEQKRKKKKKKKKEEREDEEEGDDDEYVTADEGEEDNDKQKLLAKDYIGKEYTWNVSEWNGAEIIPYSLRVENESKVYFSPSSHPPTLAERVGDQEPGLEEEEGVFVGKLPSLPLRTLNKIQNRIIHETGSDRKGWFGSDGRFQCLHDPLNKNPTRIHFQTGDELTRYVPAVPSSQAGQLIISDLAEGEHCLLELDLASMVLNHHHLFSLEHYLTRKLMELYHDYSTRVRSNSQSILTNKLRTLYVECEKVEGLALSSVSEESEFQRKRLCSYRTEIRAVRKERDDLSFGERELVKSIVYVWKDLRDVRKNQNYSVTSHKLIIHKENSNSHKDAQDWNYEIEKEFQERKHDFEETREMNVSRYEEELERWKEQHVHRKEVRQRHKRHEKDMEKGRGSVDADTFAEDEEFLSNPEPEKPVPPEEFDEEKVRLEIEKNAKKVRRNPGEPRLTLELTMGGKTTKDSDIYDNRELNRRNAVNKTKIMFKILFNGREVCQTSSKMIGQDFVVPIGQIFPIQIEQWPESLKIQIIEGSTLKTNILSEVEIPLCDSNTSLDKAEMVPYEFKSDQEISHGHAGLGSGKEFSIVSDNSRTDLQKTRGKLYARVGWGKRGDGRLLSPPADQWKVTGVNMKGQEPIREVFDSFGNVDPDKLEDWLLNHRIDPNDPRNAELMNTVSATRKSNISKSVGETRFPVDQGYFRLDQMDDQFSFCTEEQINNNVRFQMIQLRSAKAPDFRNYRQIPAYEKEIPKGILESYAKKLEYRQKDVSGSSDQLRGKNFLYLDQLRTQVQHKFSLAKHRKRRSDIITEDNIPDLNTLFMMLGGAMPEQRPLRPVRQERKKVTLQDISGQEVKVLLSVVRAYDVPVRHDVDFISSGGIQQVSNGPKESKVNSFITASLQNSTGRTYGAAGPNPAWNQQLTLKFKPLNNDFSPDSMRRVKEYLYLHLFDEIYCDLVEDEDQRSTLLHQRLEHRWLGSLAIPFTSIYQNTRIEGTFRMHSPPVLLGYERVGQNVQNLGWRPSTPTENSTVKDATYINIYLTLDPALNVPEPLREKLECEEDDDIVATCERWNRALSGAYPHRKINPLVIDVTGRSVLLTRYLRPIPPPAQVRESSTEVPSDESVAWFVSLIPYLPSNALFPGLGDIWPTSEQFLQMMVGSELEHAILLTNYFLSLGKTCFLVLGKGIPEGKTAYVLTVEENGQYWLWNPVTSEHFSSLETFCPLQSIWVLANTENVWANMQVSDQPQRLRFDLSRVGDWMPLFSRPPLNPPVSLQPDHIPLSPPDIRAAKLLKDKIEKALRDSIMNLRKKSKLRTSLNFQGKALLGKLLPRLEQERINGSRGRGTAGEHGTELQTLTSSYKICGFPLHCAYLDMESIVDSVKATGVWSNRDPGVEFGLAVYVEPYPGSAMSVWVYVASLVKRV